MTVSSSSVPRPRPNLLLIAGLNNNDDALVTLAEDLRARGFICDVLNLPGQGTDRSETESEERARKVFEDRMSGFDLKDYGVIAFSTGALYYNLWLREHEDLKPRFEILLAPAFRIRNARFLAAFFKRLHGKLIIKSLAPKKFRRYNWLKVSEYQLLFSLHEKFQLSGSKILAPFKIFVDERDELVDARALKNEFPVETEVVRRQVGKVSPGMFHSLFHPVFWKKNEWEEFVGKVVRFMDEN